MVDETIAYRALEKLERLMACKTELRKDATNKELEGVVYLEYEGRQIRLNTQIRKVIHNAQLPLLLENALKYQPDYLLIANKISPGVKEELRKERIAYLEGNGNFFINQARTGGLLVYIDGNKPLEEKRAQANRAFTKTGLKVIFHFLQDEALINKPYREIAEQAGTALGNITNILNGLRAAGFLIKENKDSYRLVKKKELLSQWVTAYEQVLKPKLEVGRFRFTKEAFLWDWRSIPLANGLSWWGGEPAGNILTDYLKPEDFTLYTLESKAELMRRYHLRPDQAGSISVYKKFWEGDDDASQVVPPLLVYADLMNTGDRRCIETARRVFDEYLQNKF